jgi:thiol-disulfide isomerase/thioredoxin
VNSPATPRNRAWVIFIAALVAVRFMFPTRADVGDAAKLKTVLLDGKRVSLEQLKGKVVMVNFWATWCPTCKVEMPQWQKLYDAYKDKGFELIALSIDDDEKLLRQVSKERGFSFPIAWRWDDKTDDNFGDIIGTPTLCVVDKEWESGVDETWPRDVRPTQEIIDPP